MDTKEIKNDGSRIEKNYDEELKEADYEHAQPTHDCKLQFSNCLEHNATSSIQVQRNNAYGIHVLDSSEELPPNSSEFSMLSVHSSEQIGIYEQIQCYERIEHCDVNLAHLISKHSPASVQVENIANTTSSKQIPHSTQPHCHLPDCGQECIGHDPENPSRICRKQSQENKSPIEAVRHYELSNAVRLNNASVPAESPTPVCEDESPQENATDTRQTGTNSCNDQPTELTNVQSDSFTKNCEYQNLQGEETYRQSQGNVYERIHHCDLSIEFVPHSSIKIARSDPLPHVVEGASQYERVKHCDLPVKLMLTSAQDKETCNQSQGNTYERIHHCDLPIESIPHALKIISRNDSPPHVLEGASEYERIEHCDLSLELSHQLKYNKV